MRRILSFRDFDWTLLGMVMLLCTISVLEIYSATLHTKYCGLPHQADVLDRRRPGGHVRPSPRSTITS
jgi:cell division protein FtsW (lipid II flippase)